MNGELCLRNRQRTRSIHLRLLRRIARTLLTDFFCPQRFELCIHLVAATEMARLNNMFLGHPGSTDVLTFDYSDSGFGGAQNAGQVKARNSKLGTSLHGEIFICIDDAVAQARQFRTTWQSELVRYLIHGLLHLQGFDDLNPAARNKMKREENRLLREVAKQFPLSRLAQASRKSQIANHKSR